MNKRTAYEMAIKELDVARSYCVFMSNRDPERFLHEPIISNDEWLEKSYRYQEAIDILTKEMGGAAPLIYIKDLPDKVQKQIVRDLLGE